jgi:ABC-type antimicrobial peptide transport system permease subunit
MVVGQGMRLTTYGLAIGTAGALLLARIMQSLLYEVKPNDPLVYGLTVLVLLMVSVIACWIPAYRASRVDPLTALRDD